MMLRKVKRWYNEEKKKLGNIKRGMEDLKKKDT